MRQKLKSVLERRREEAEPVVARPKLIVNRGQGDGLKQEKGLYDWRSEEQSLRLVVTSQ